MLLQLLLDLLNLALKRNILGDLLDLARVGGVVEAAARGARSEPQERSGHFRAPHSAPFLQMHCFAHFPQQNAWIYDDKRTLSVFR